MERARLGKVFEQGLDTVIGHVLPVARCLERRTLAHGPLVPAERALLPDPRRFSLGYRLPLDSQPWVKESD